MNVRGRIVMPSRPNSLGVTGPIPGIVVYAKAHNSRVKHEFLRFCHLNGIDARLVHEGVEPGRDAYECLGGIASLRKLIGHSTVAHWHYVMSVRPPRLAARDDFAPCPKDASPRVRREVRVRRLPLAAQNDMDAMESWDVSDRTRHELAKEEELPR